MIHQWNKKFIYSSFVLSRWYFVTDRKKKKKTASYSLFYNQRDQYSRINDICVILSYT